MTRTATFAPFALAGILAACGGTTPSWSPLKVDSLPDSQKQQMQKALGARDALAKDLLDKLTTTIQEKGPAAAIPVCREEAPRIAIGVATRFGVQIGRTSDRLRNPGNIPPPWSSTAIAQRAAQPSWFVGPAGELGALLPIRIQPTCLLCHGPKETLAADVSAQLGKLYEGDTATGYKVDDLRGWFWVEVPK